MSSQQHVQNMGPNLFAHNENSAYIMPRVTARGVMSCVHRAACACTQASQPPYVFVVCQELLMDMLFTQAE